MKNIKKLHQETKKEICDKYVGSFFSATIEDKVSGNNPTCVLSSTETTFSLLIMQ